MDFNPVFGLVWDARQQLAITDTANNCDLISIWCITDGPAAFLSPIWVLVPESGEIYNDQEDVIGLNWRRNDILSKVLSAGTARCILDHR